MAINYCKTKKICIGDLKYRITIQTRSLGVPQDVDFKEEYTELAKVWAAVEINNSKFEFDKVNIDESITHLFYIRFRSDIDINNWILYRDKRYNILATRELNFERNFLQLLCNFKGDVSVEASKW